jgi:hypothetical protein
VVTSFTEGFSRFVASTTAPALNRLVLMDDDSWVDSGNTNSLSLEKLA